jgi:hypothetical protein
MQCACTDQHRSSKLLHQGLQFVELRIYLRVVVAKINCRIRGLQQPLLNTTGRDQHLLAEVSYSGSRGGQCCSGMLRHISSFLFLPSNSTFMMVVDTKCCREVAVFDILTSATKSNSVVRSARQRSPNENGSGHHVDGGFARLIVDKRGSQRIKWDALRGCMSLHATPPWNS